MIDFRCDACGFDNTTLANDELVDLIAVAADRFAIFLRSADDAALRVRPAPSVWSPLEYAVHQREVIAFYGGRIEAIATTDEPQLHEYGFGEAADRDNYNAEDPVEVAAQIERAAALAVVRLRALSPDDWTRIGRASTPAAPPRDIRNCASRLAHEFVHHGLDIGLDIENGGTTGRP